MHVVRRHRPDVAPILLAALSLEVLFTLAAFAAQLAIPRFVEMVADLPRTENGKVRKYELRERGVTALAWDREAAGYRLKRG